MWPSPSAAARRRLCERVVECKLHFGRCIRLWPSNETRKKSNLCHWTRTKKSSKLSTKLVFSLQLHLIILQSLWISKYSNDYLLTSWKGLSATHFSFETHLCLRVGTRPAENARATKFGNFLVQTMRQDDGERHAFFGLVGRVSKHQSLEEISMTN